MKNRENSEKYLESRLVKKVSDMGSIALKFTSSTLAGFPDRLVLLKDGISLWVELKSKGEKPTKLQQYRIKQLKKLGHRVEVIDNKKDLDNLFNSLTTKTA